jgi:DNA-binding LacI/PurR family transcriptional regulator
MTTKAPKVSKETRGRVEKAIESLLAEGLEPTTRAIRQRMKKIGGASISQPTLLEAARPWRDRHLRPVEKIVSAYAALDPMQRREFRVRMRKAVTG